MEGITSYRDVVTVLVVNEETDDLQACEKILTANCAVTHSTLSGGIKSGISGGLNLYVPCIRIDLGDKLSTLQAVEVALKRDMCLSARGAVFLCLRRYRIAHVMYYNWVYCTRLSVDVDTAMIRKKDFCDDWKWMPLQDFMQDCGGVHCFEAGVSFIGTGRVEVARKLFDDLDATAEKSMVEYLDI